MQAHPSDLRYPIGKPVLPSARITPAERAVFIEQIAALPVQLTVAARKAGGERLQFPYRVGGWTGRQVLHHLADVHMNFYFRFRLALTEQHPAIPAFNQNASAELADVEATPVTVSLSLLEALHVRWTVLLWHLTEEQWQKSFFHPVYQKDFTLEQALVQYAWHGRHHLAHIHLLSLS